MTTVQHSENDNPETNSVDARVQVRLSPALTAKVDAMLATERARLPGVNLTRADIVRTLVERAFASDLPRTEDDR